MKEVWVCRRTIRRKGWKSVIGLVDGAAWPNMFDVYGMRLPVVAWTMICVYFAVSPRDQSASEGLHDCL